MVKTTNQQIFTAKTANIHCLNQQICIANIHCLDNPYEYHLTDRQNGSTYTNVYKSHMRTMVLVYAHQHLPLSKISQFCGFLYTSTMVRISDMRI